MVPKIKDLTKNPGAPRFGSFNICRLRWLHNHYPPKSETLLLLQLHRGEKAYEFAPHERPRFTLVFGGLLFAFFARLLMLRNQLPIPPGCLLGFWIMFRKSERLESAQLQAGCGDVAQSIIAKSLAQYSPHQFAKSTEQNINGLDRRAHICRMTV